MQQAQQAILQRGVSSSSCRRLTTLITHQSDMYQRDLLEGESRRTYPLPSEYTVSVQNLLRTVSDMEQRHQRFSWREAELNYQHAVTEGLQVASGTNFIFGMGSKVSRDELIKLFARIRTAVSRSDKELVLQNMTRDLYETMLTPPTSYNCTQGVTSIPRGLGRGGRPHGTGLHLRDGSSSYLCRILSVEILDCFENGLFSVGDIIHPEAYIFVKKNAGKPILYNMALFLAPRLAYA